MIYIASPYSHDNPTHRQVNYRCALFYAAFLKQRGYLCFSPVAYGHQFAETCGLGTDAKSWLAFNTHMLSHSTALHVLKLAGWEDSKGIKMELLQARKSKLPVIHIDHLTFRQAKPGTPSAQVG